MGGKPKYGRCGSWWRGGFATPFMGGAFPWGRSGRWGRFFGPGEIRLALLSVLEPGPEHGYELMKELETKSGGHLEGQRPGQSIPGSSSWKTRNSRPPTWRPESAPDSLTGKGRAELQPEAAPSTKSGSARSRPGAGLVDGHGRSRGQASRSRSHEVSAAGCHSRFPRWGQDCQDPRNPGHSEIEAGERS